MSAIEPAPFRLPEQPVEVDIVAKYFRALGDPTRLASWSRSLTVSAR